MLSKEEIEKLEVMTNRCNNCGEVKELGFCPDCYMDFDDSKTIRNLFREYKQLEADKQKLIDKLEKDMQDNIETVKYYENAIQNNPNATDKKSWLRSKTIALTRYKTEREILIFLKGEQE